MAATPDRLPSDLKFVAKLPNGIPNDTQVVQAYLSGAPLQPLSYDVQHNLRTVASILDPLDAWTPRSDRLLGRWFGEKGW